MFRTSIFLQSQKLRTASSTYYYITQVLIKVNIRASEDTNCPFLLQEFPLLHPSQIPSLQSPSFTFNLHPSLALAICPTYVLVFCQSIFGNQLKPIVISELYNKYSCGEQKRIRKYIWLSSMSFWNHSLSTSLSSGIMYCSSLILCFACHSPGIGYFFQMALVSWKMVFRS